jgi:hypothetical protein
MYCRMMANGATPHEAARYDGDHRCPVQGRPVHRARELLAEESGGDAF